MLRHPRRTLAIFTGLNLLNYLDRYVIASLLTPIKNSLSLSDAELGRISTVFMLGYFLSSPFFGYWSDRGSRKRIVAIGIFVWSLGTFFTGFASTLAWILFFRILVGFGEASYATAGPSLIMDIFPEPKRNNALTVFYVAIPVGSALGYILGGLVNAHYGWREAFFFAGAPGLLLAFFLMRFEEPKRGGMEMVPSKESAALPRVADIFSLFKIRDYQLVVWGYTAYTFALGAYAYWGPTFLERIHGIENKAAATFFGAVLVVTGLFGTLLGGFLATAWQKKNPAAYAWVLAISVLLATPFSALAFFASSPNVSMTCMALAMFFVFLPTGPINTLIMETVPVALRSSAMAISLFIIHLFGDIWSPEIVGRLSDHWGNLRSAVLILPVAFLVSAAIWLVLAFKTKRVPTPSEIPAPA